MFVLMNVTLTGSKRHNLQVLFRTQEQHEKDQ